MTVDVQISDAAFRHVARQRARAGDRERVIAAAHDHLGAAFEALGQVLIDQLMGLFVVARNVRDVAAVDHLEEGQDIDIVLEHVRKVLRRRFPQSRSALRGAGPDDLALIPGATEETNLGSHLPDRIAIGRAVGGAHEGGKTA